MRILAIDPGTEKSGWLLFETASSDSQQMGTVLHYGIESNVFIVRAIDRQGVDADILAIEMMQTQGMAVGQSTFEACAWIGAFWHAFGMDKYKYITRNQEKMSICGNMKAKGPNIRRALIDMFGGQDKAIGDVKCRKCKGKGWFGAGRPPCPVCQGAKWLHPPGPLAGITEHVWSALAVCVTYIKLYT